MVFNSACKEDAYIPRIIPYALYLPGRRVTEFKILLKNVSGALNSITETLYKHKVNIHSIYLSPVTTEETAWCTLFADFTNATAPPKEVAEELRRKRKLLNVEYVEEKDFLVDTYHFKLVTPIGRIYVLNVNAYAEIVKALRDLFGSAADYILFLEGVKYGEAVAKEYFKIFPFLSGKNRDDLTKFFFDMARTAGFAVLEVKELNLDRGIAHVIAHSLSECEPFKGQLNSTNSQYFRGVMTGIVRTVMGCENLVFIEEECVAKNDPYCSFKLEKIKPPP